MFSQETILKTVGKSHMAPLEYTYVLKLYINSSYFLTEVKDEKHTFIGNINSTTGNPYIISGYNKINDIDLWVINQEKQGYYYFWFKTRKDTSFL
jgi:hypothetical protein